MERGFNNTILGKVNGGSSLFSSKLIDLSGLPYQFFVNLPFGEIERSEDSSNTNLKNSILVRQTLYEQHASTDDYETPYLFNGKEFDEETQRVRRTPLKNKHKVRQTGLYYYGARYAVYPAKSGKPKTSIWLSIDPLAEKYPNFSPYAYTFNNPLNFVDPTGMAGEDWYQDKSGNVKWFNGSGKRDGYVNIGTSTNLSSGVKNQNLQLNSNGTVKDLNSGKLYGYNKTISIGSFTVKTKTEGHYFAEAKANVTVGIQVGVKLTDNASVSAGALSTDVGTFGYSTDSGFINEYGDGSNHNYIEGKLKVSDKLQVFFKGDHIFEHMPQANMKNDSYFDGQLGLGNQLLKSPLSGGDYSKLGGSTSSFIKFGRDEISVDFSTGLKVVLGVDAHVKFGYKF